MLRITQDTLTPYFKSKIGEFPTALNNKFMAHSLMIIKQKTHDYVPRNSTPPPEMDGYGKPGGKQKAGDLQDLGYFTDIKTNRFNSYGEFGYNAYDSYKHEYYALKQHENNYRHPVRYAGHKPRRKYLKTGALEATDYIFDYLGFQFNKFLQK